MKNPEKAWKNKATRVSRKVNSGWFLDKLSPILILGGFIFALTVLCLRSMGSSWATPLWLGIGGGVLLLVAILFGFYFARKHFIDQRDGLIRLDDRLGMNNSLLTASQGVNEWPSAPNDEEDPVKQAGLSWNVPALLVPLLVTIALVVASIFVPIKSVMAAVNNLPPNEPAAWQQMEEWLDELEEENLIEEKSLEEAREKIDELREQPEDNWFSHSSMEATDSLKESLSRDLQEMNRDLQTLERDLNALQNFSTEMSEEAKQMMMKEYGDALKDLGLNNMELNKELAQQLKQMQKAMDEAMKKQGLTPSEAAQQMLSQLSKEQLEQLRENLKNGCQ